MSQSHIGGVSRREFLAKVAAGGAGALMSFAGPVIEPTARGLLRPFIRHRTLCVHAGEPLIRSTTSEPLRHRWIQHGIAALSAKGLGDNDASS